jgi:hypothetical protein
VADSIHIDTGTKRILVNDDPARVIRFNPSDVVFAEKFYRLISDFQSKQQEYQARAKDLDARAHEQDENGVPVTVGAGLAFLREVCEYLRQKIDDLFGAGTAQAAFEDAMTLEMFEDFFVGITPFIQKARADKTRRYLNDKHTGRVME